MKKTFFLIGISLFIGFYMNGQPNITIPQNIPTDYKNSFTFTLGSKILIELKETTPGKFEYKVLDLQRITDYYSMDKRENIFDKKPKDNTVELFFMGAYYNDGSEDRDWKTVLIIRNNLKKHINYKADIKYYYNNQFENTSIVGAFPGTNTTEIWAHKIDFITLYDFELFTF